MREKTTDYSDHGFLIVDDKAFLRGIVQSMLMLCQAGRIERASNGTEAVKALARNSESIDCVLCDWNMRPVDGLEVLRSIRSGRIYNTPRDLCVIMLTGHADEHLVKTALALDANGYMVKPVSMAKLVEAIDRAFARPVILKPKVVYDSIGCVDLPEGTSDKSAKRTLPWVLWSEMGGEVPANRGDRLEKIRAIATEKAGYRADNEREVVNLICMDITSIPDGKVLAEDIFTEKGFLLLASGTVLSEALLGRLCEITKESALKAQLIVGDFED
ncbi:response regulator [Oceanibacterium hippocampi]|uniref:Chemotaxis protein CheY n=1 Tax=Oceanibacterium hippocampi TaxID=745714 RepID=A0A1Y5U0X8_9PROT|nr:response regulator [Oceanibacterium hippocampi]SLN73956.1 Chemotaxis protein CheY [Oceanibacterium hippocampi]